MDTTLRAAIVGISGTVLTDAERTLLRECPPAGIILFGRNIAGAVQLAALMAQLRDALAADALLMVDQEGGRVARLRPPDWHAHPAAGAIGAIHDADPARAVRVAWLTGALIGTDCAAAGFDVACAPVLDLRRPGVTDAIGDRAFHGDAGVVARLGGALAGGLLAAGVQPVGKHAPGHGRAVVDSHHELPRVEADDLDADIAAFALCRDLPWMMTAHIVFAALDADLPATLSARVIGDVIRARIGFAGVLCSDDLAMAALSGAPTERATGALRAGCDVALYCPGDADATSDVLRAVPPLTPAAHARLGRAAALAQAGRLALDPAALIAERDSLLP